jgi:hypothetical protein
MKKLLLLFVLASAGCFSVTQPLCSFTCADEDPKCPVDYVCLSDGYCHLHGNSQSCGFSDAAVPNDLAMSLPVDMSTD